MRHDEIGVRLNEISFIRNTMDVRVYELMEQRFPKKFELINKINRMILELHVAYSKHNSDAETRVDVDITEEYPLKPSLSQLCEGLTVENILARRAIAKKKAKPLNTLYHPDKDGGDAVKFDIVRKAIQQGDLETIHYLLLVEDRLEIGEDPSEVETKLIDTIEGQLNKLKGSKAFSLVRLLMTNSMDEFYRRSEILLNELLSSADRQLPAPIVSSEEYKDAKTKAT